MNLSNMLCNTVNLVIKHINHTLLDLTIMASKKNDNRKRNQTKLYILFPILWLTIFSNISGPLQEETYPPGNWDTVIEHQDFKTTLKLDKGDENTLILGATFHDIEGDAIRLRNVSNVYIKDCVIHNINGNGIVLRSTGSTENVTIDGCVIHDTTKNGIITKQDHSNGVDHTNLVIKNNRIFNVGSSRLHHGMYIQSQDSLITNNEIHGISGNGVSIRSSGIVRANRIWDTNKSCIRYFSDNVTGQSKTLLIENNVCYLTRDGLESPAIGLLWWDEVSPDWVVENFIIRLNTVALFTDQRVGIAVESSQLDDKNVEGYCNIVINTESLSATITDEHIDYYSSNYISTSLDDFVNGQSYPYAYCVTELSNAVDYVNVGRESPLR